MMARRAELALRPLDRTNDRSGPLDHYGEQVTTDAGDRPVRDSLLQKTSELGQQGLPG